VVDFIKFYACKVRLKQSKLDIQAGTHALTQCFQNALAYITTAISYAHKMFINVAPGLHVAERRSVVRHITE